MEEDPKDVQPRDRRVQPELFRDPEGLLLGQHLDAVLRHALTFAEPVTTGSGTRPRTRASASLTFTSP